MFIQSNSELVDQDPLACVEETPAEIGRVGSLHAQGRMSDALEEIERLLTRKPDYAEAYCVRALIQMDLGDYSQSAVSWERFHELAQPDSSSRLARAECHEQLGRWAEAADEFRAILSDDPNCDEASLRLGLSLLRTQQPEEAISLLTKYLERHSEHSAARFGLAVAYQLVGEPDEAVRLYDELIQEKRHREEALTNLMGIHRQRKDASKLAEVSRTLLEESPGSIAGMEGAAQAAFLQEDYLTAASYCDEASRIEGGRPERWMNLALCRRKLGQTELALQAYEAAASLSPELTEAHVRIAELRLEKGQAREALEACRQGIVACPDSEELFFLLSAAHQADGNARDAEGALEVLVARHPECADGWFSLGNLRLQRHDNHGAQAAYWACLSLRESWPEVRLNLSLAYCAEGKYADAWKELEALLEERPDWEPVLRAAATASLKLGQAEVSLKCHQRLIDLALADAEVYYNAGILSEQAGRGAEAAGLFAKAIELRPGFAEALVGMGHALEREGRQEEARQCWARAMEMNPALARQYFRLT